MPQAPDSLQPSIGYQPHPFKQALDHVVNTIMAAQGSGSQQPWGFHEPTITAGQAVGPAAQAAGDVLSDPRNAWMGLGPIAGMARFKRVPELGRELGGFNTPTSKMRKSLGLPKPNRRLSEVPGGDEAEARSLYLGSVTGFNQMADVMHKGPFGENAPKYLAAQDLHSQFSPVDQKNMEQVLKGRLALMHDLLQQNLPGGGGRVPSDIELKRFGYKPQ